MRKPHRFLAAALSALCLTAALPVGAQDAPAAVSVELDGRTLCAGEARLIADRTYLPLRAFCADVGISGVVWAPDERAAYVTADGLSMRAGIGDRWITVNGRPFWAADEVRLVDGVTMVPVRPLARALGLAVEWDGDARRVLLTDSGQGYAAAAESVYSADDLYWLSRIISAESRGEPLEGQLAVGNVVLNRVASPEFPDTIYDVIFDRRYAIQFTPVANGSIYAEPTDSALLAAKLALEGVSVSDEILYFLNPDLSTSFWIVHNRPFAMTIGTHDFYT